MYIIRYKQAGKLGFVEVNAEHFTIWREEDGFAGEAWSPRTKEDELSRISTGPQGVLYDQYGLVAVTWSDKPVVVPKVDY